MSVIGLSSATKSNSPTQPSSTDAASGTNQAGAATGNSSQQPYTTDASSNSLTPVIPPQTQEPQTQDSVLQTARNTAVNQTANPLDAQLAQVSSNYLSDPNMGKNYDANKQSQLEQFDRQRSAAQEAARAQLGDTSQSGELGNEFMRNMLDTQADRSTLSNTIDENAMKERQTNLLNALNSSQATSKLESDNTSAGINNLTNVLSAGEGSENRTFTAAQDAIDKAWKTGERLGDEDFKAKISEMDHAWQTGERMSTQDFQTNMTNLNAQIASAEADKDVGRKSQLLTLQSNLTMEQDAQKQGYAIALQNNQGAIDKALKDGDYTHAMALQTSQQQFTATESAKDRAVKQFEDQLTQQGINITALQNAFEQGAIDVDSYTTALNAMGSKLGIKVSSPDPTKVAAAAAQQYSDLGKQWGLSHKSDTTLVNTDGSLTDEGKKKFATYYNEQMYGESDSTQAASSAGVDESLTFGSTAGTGRTQAIMQFDASGNMTTSSGAGIPVASGDKFSITSSASVGYVSNYAIPKGVYTKATGTTSVPGGNKTQSMQFASSSDGSLLYPIGVNTNKNVVDGSSYFALMTATINGATYKWDSTKQAFAKQ